MAESGVDIRNADLMIGTSSGGRVALQLASGAPLEEVFARQSGAAQHVRRPAASPVDWGHVQREVARAKELGGDRAEILRRYGQLALQLAAPDHPGAPNPSPAQEWPERPVRLIALNAATGVRRAFDRASGIDVASALRATTASFGAAPVWFEDQPYIDGGYYSGDNADLAAGYDRVLVLTLKAPPWAMRLVSLEDGIAELRAAGVTVEVIQPDEEATEVIASAGSPMNPAVFEPVTRAGRAQGRRVVAQRGIAGWW